MNSTETSEQGTVSVQTKSGAHVTSDAVIEALKLRAEKRAAAARTVVSEEQREIAEAYREPKADIDRLKQLAPVRAIRRVVLNTTRFQRRANRRWRKVKMHLNL